MQLMREDHISTRQIATWFQTTTDAVNHSLHYWGTHRATQVRGITRPRRLSERDARHLVAQFRKGNLTTVKDGATYLRDHLQIKLSISAVRAALLRHNMRYKSTVFKTKLTKFDKKRRLAWAKQHEAWTVEDWKKVVFTDETMYKAFEDSRRTLHKWIHKEDENFLNLISYVSKRSDCRVAAWGCITSQGAGRLVPIDATLNSATYIDILERELKATLISFNMDVGDVVFQHDNAAVHTSGATRRYLNENGFLVLDWPPYSPDLNIIEHIWARTQREVLNNSESITSKFDLIEAAKKAFEKFSAEDLSGYYESMPRRIRAVIEARGGPTKF